MSTSRQGTLRRVQDGLDRMVESLVSFERPSFGQDFCDLTGSALADALVLHRMTSKYEKHDSTAAEARKAATMSKTLSYDNDGWTRFRWTDLNTREQRVKWLEAQEWLQKTYRKFKRKYRFVPPSGESAEAAFGYVDVMFKLDDLRFWEVSPAALPSVIAIIYGNAHLKAVVRKHFSRVCLDRSGMEPDQFKRYYRAQWYSGERKNSLGYYVFGKMVTLLMTLSDISRMSTVPKNNRTDRPIDMVPFWNMVAQLSYMRDLRDCYLDAHGVDIERTADIHKMLIREARYATIDLKDASNSVWMCVIRELWPKRAVKDLESLRTSTTVAHINGEDVYHHYNMFGPMGCGLTFDVMTLTLHAIVQTFGFASVFGDDIICDAAEAPGVITMLEAIGLKTNVEKTFIHGNFRESCGGYHDLQQGVDLVSYDFKRPENLLDAFTCINKLKVIVEAEQVSNDLKAFLTTWWFELSQMVPPSFSVWEGDVGCGAVIRTVDGRPHTVLSDMWQRPVMLGRIVSMETRPVKDISGFLSSEHCHMLRGRFYKPAKRKTFMRQHVIDITTGVRISNIQLASVI